MVPASALVRQASAHAGTHLAGDVCGEDAAPSGARAGAAAAAGTPSGATTPPAAVPPALEGRGKCVVCFCEDVTTKDLKLTVAEGYESLELAKRYSTVTMGPCQGRMCHANAARAVAAATGLDTAAVGQTTARPPWSTVPMGALAGRPFEPAKRSALHVRHRELGANVRWAGDWRRAYDYGDPEGEALAVGQDAGIIDVSTLGKLVVRGPDAGELLDRLYPNTMSSLKPGRIRYGVLTSDAGRITDDGTVARIDDETFYVTTTSAGAAAVEQWFTWWLAVWRLDADVTDVTQGVAAMNVAGPRAREILAALCDTDVSGEAFAYLDAHEANVAGVPCLLLRIGFVGEVGYEIHCPAPQALHVWDAATALGARPFGLEPQRVLRLQKLHVIVGQDTDSESTPAAAAMPWIVKLDKPQEFIGRWALEHAAQTPAPFALVGFRCDELPSEGAVVLGDDGRPAGQVTSARRSPRLGEVIGMAWVPAERAHDEQAISISDDGRVLTGFVTTRPFYDPDGEVVRS
jgi:sarcosine oxidase subunit alpha